MLESLYGFNVGIISEHQLTEKEMDIIAIEIMSVIQNKVSSETGKKYEVVVSGDSNNLKAKHLNNISVSNDKITEVIEKIDYEVPAVIDALDWMSKGINHGLNEVMITNIIRFLLNNLASK